MSDSQLILFCTANDGHLPAISKEREYIYDATFRAQQRNIVEIEPLAQFTFKVLFDRFHHLDKAARIRVLHYSGHSGRHGLILQDASGQPQLLHKDRLSAFLEGPARELRLVFLNSCYSQPVADQLLDAGVPAVLGTGEEVSDADAAKIAGKFYQALGNGARLREAFQSTQDFFQSEKDNANSLFGGIDLGGAAFPWALKSQSVSDKEWQLVPVNVQNRLEAAGAGSRKLLFVHADEDQAVCYRERLLNYLAGQNITAYNVWEIDELRLDERQAAVDAADAIIYIITSALRRHIEERLSWLPDFVNPQKGKIVVVGDESLDAGIQFLKERQMLREGVFEKLGETYMTFSFLEANNKLIPHIEQAFGPALTEQLGLSVKNLQQIFESFNFEVQWEQLRNWDVKTNKLFFILQGTPRCGQELFLKHLIRTYTGKDLDLQRDLFEVKLGPQYSEYFSSSFAWQNIYPFLDPAVLNGIPVDAAKATAALRERLEANPVVIVLNDLMDSLPINALQDAAQSLWQDLLAMPLEPATANPLIFCLVSKSLDPGQASNSPLPIHLPPPPAGAQFAHLVFPPVEPVKPSILREWHLKHRGQFASDHPFRRLLTEHQQAIVNRRVQDAIDQSCCFLQAQELIDELFELKQNQL
ncbi:MAG: CHAT domain-containing protein [Phaeodactylibacter xiamenensis]|uniref:CHAT domain-containing protein n=1 Tax=Phaeodactylibacter xiamenensis TaxID=1524460 RepID=A0A098S183_9BACT|nr:hypothetical protein IX84_24980 [Phaeodactylibacter xiamenensis]